MLENMDKYPERVHADWLWADYIEFCCLNSVDKIATISDIYDTVKENQESNRESEEDSRSLHISEIDDQLMSRIHERFNFLAIRSKLFPQKYPFKINLKNHEISLKNEKGLLHNYSPYLFLLLSSGLRYHHKGQRNRLTKMFEKVSKKTLKNLLSSNAEVHLFSSQNPEMPTTAWGKIEWLSKELNTPILSNKKRFEGNIAGEAGIDIVAWHKMGDSLCNRPLYFAQVTCSTEGWPGKVSDSSSIHWSNILLQSNPSTNLMFIPHSYRDAAYNFPRPDETRDAILFDRSRILKYFSDSDMLLNEPSIRESLENLIN